MLAITTHNLTKRYGKRLAVDGLELSVRPGDIYGYLGLNGAGKTTTIRMLLGMVRPTLGEVRIFGATVRPGSYRLWKSVGHLVETAVAYPDLTVRENLDIMRRLFRVKDRKATDRIVERLGLAPYADQRARTLSLGNLQRLGLAKALLHEPELVILDEPANGLDPAGVVEIRELIADLARQRGTTVLMSSHVLTEVDRLATRIGVIHEGRLVEELNADEIERRRQRRLVIRTRNPEVARAALLAAGFRPTMSSDSLGLEEQDAIENPDSIARLLVESGAAPTALFVEQDDLETHFLRLVSRSENSEPPRKARHD